MDSHPDTRDAVLRVADPRHLGRQYPVPGTIFLSKLGNLEVLRYGAAGGVQPALAPSEDPALIEFARLWDQDSPHFPDAVLSFARRWGPLELCDAHLRPFAHTLVCQPWQDRAVVSAEWAEPVATWRRYSRSLHALLCLLADSQEYERYPSSDNELWLELAWVQPRPSDWSTAPQTFSPGAPQWAGDGRPVPVGDVEKWPLRVPRTRAEADLALTEAVKIWLNWTPLPLQPYCERRSGAPSLGRRAVWGATLRTTGLAGRLTTELAGAIAAGPRIFRCSTRGQPYVIAERRPSENPARRHHCDRCRDGGRYTAPKTVRQRERRRLLREARNSAAGTRSVPLQG
ncbi:MAG: hypothetical protein ACLQNU_09985 [Candidatus Dormibacteria bacterium]